MGIFIEDSSEVGLWIRTNNSNTLTKKIIVKSIGNKNHIKELKVDPLFMLGKIYG